VGSCAFYRLEVQQILSAWKPVPGFGAGTAVLEVTGNVELLSLM